MACREDTVLLLNPALGDQLAVGNTDHMLAAFTPPEEPALQPARWLEASEEERQEGLRLRVCHSQVRGRGGCRWKGKGRRRAHSASLASRSR